MTEETKKPEEVRSENIQDTLKHIQELEHTARLEDLIKDNAIEFFVEEKKYRVRQLTPGEKKEIFKEQRKLYTKLVFDESYKFKKEWIVQYKKQGIDIEVKEELARQYQAEQNKVLLKLSEIDDEKVVEELKAEVVAIREKIYAINFEIAQLLEFSIEQELETFSKCYTVSKVVEKQIEKGWESYFKTYAEFEVCKETNFIQAALFYYNYLPIEE